VGRGLSNFPGDAEDLPPLFWAWDRHLREPHFISISVAGGKLECVQKDSLFQNLIWHLQLLVPLHGPDFPHIASPGQVSGKTIEAILEIHPSESVTAPLSPSQPGPNLHSTLDPIAGPFSTWFIPLPFCAIGLHSLRELSLALLALSAHR
jgi:hypothetical protein